MRTILQLRDDIDNHVKNLGAMKAQCMTENRDANEDEIGKSNEILDKIDDLEELLATEMRTQETLDRLKAPAKKPERTPVDVRKDQKEQRNRDSFASQGEFFQAVMRAGSPERIVDPRLTTKRAEGLSEGIPSDGGFLVDTEMSGGIMKNVWEASPILSRISKTTLSGNKNGMKFNGIDETSRATGSRYGGITGYWKAEAALKTKSTPTFRQIELNLNKLIGLCYATDELLDDAAALEQTIKEGFSAEFDFLLANAIINGTGAGQPLGINNAGCVISVGAEVGQTSNTVVFENINKMWSRMMASSRPNAIWICNQDVEPQLHQMSIAVGTGGVPVYMPAGGMAAAPHGTLFGRPVVAIEQCPVLGENHAPC